MTNWTSLDYVVMLAVMGVGLSAYIFPKNPGYKRTLHVGVLAAAFFYATAKWKCALGLFVFVNLGWRFLDGRLMSRLRDTLSATSANPKRKVDNNPVPALIAGLLISPLAAYCVLFGVSVHVSDAVFHRLGLLPIDFGGMRPSMPKSWNHSIADMFVRLYANVFGVVWTVRLLKLSPVDTRQRILFLRKFSSPRGGLTRTQITPALGAFGRVVTLYDATFAHHRPRDPIGTFEPLSGYVLRLRKQDDWKSIVAAAMDWADAVVVELTEASDAIRWELHEIAQRKMVARTLLITYYTISDGAKREVAVAGLAGARLVCFKSQDRLRHELFDFARANKMIA